MWTVLPMNEHDEKPYTKRILVRLHCTRHAYRLSPYTPRVQTTVTRVQYRLRYNIRIVDRPVIEIGCVPRTVSVAVAVLYSVVCRVGTV